MTNLLIAAEIDFESYRLINQKNCIWKVTFLEFRRNGPYDEQNISIR